MKRITTPVILLLLLLGVTVEAVAQLDERLEPYRVAFFTERLNLTTEEAKAFWPLYNEHKAKLKDLKETSGMNRIAAVRRMTDEEAETYMNRYYDYKQKELALEIESMNKFKEVLPVRKVAMIPRVEQQFRTELLRKLRERAEQRRRNR